VILTLSSEDSGSTQRVFTATANDNNYGSGISNITLYVDEIPVTTWIDAGIHSYSEDAYLMGTHVYYFEAFDNACNSARNSAF
jgi:hypothetical protein